jgi:hypothetical protein
MEVIMCMNMNINFLCLNITFYHCWYNLIPNIIFGNSKGMGMD